MRDAFEQRLSEHFAADEKQFKSIDGKLDKILDNHLHHLEADSATMKTDIFWLRWGMMTTAGAVVVGVVGLLFSLFRNSH